MADQTPKPRVTLPGSERSPLEGARALGPVSPNDQVEVSVYLRPPTTSNLAKDIADRVVGQQKPLSREEYATSHAASPEDIALVEQFAHEYNLTVIEVDATRRVVRLSGTVEAINAAFEAQLQNYDYQGTTYRGRAGALTIPAELADVVIGVFGIDNRPQ
ncbi:MAG TPA: protease pro-enzyme activation domain-containing protein, partial [Ktedonobacteraceae bacterium]